MRPLSTFHFESGLMIWMSFFHLFLGTWLLLTPVTFGYYAESTLASSDFICGIVLIIAGWCSRRKSCLWAPWIICGIGVWLQLAPLIFWAKHPAVYLNDTLVGILAIVFSILIPGIPGVVEPSGRETPPGWSYNPSSWVQRLPVISLAVFGWFASRYLAAYQLGFINTMWDPLFGSGTVEVITSSISRSFPIPDAGLGALAYTLEALLGCKGGSARWRTMPWLVISFGILVVPVGLTSIILIILQPLIVGAWCTVCLMTAAAMLIMIALTLDEVVATCQFLRSYRNKNRSFWPVFWKGGQDESEEKDTRTPPLDAPLKTLLPSAGWGCSIPWNLGLTVLIGAWLMSSPTFFDLTGWQASSSQILGALTITVSVISMAEIARNVRLILAILGFYLALTCFTPLLPWPCLLNQAVSGILLILFSLRKGKIQETYGNNK